MYTKNVRRRVRATRSAATTNSHQELRHHFIFPSGTRGSRSAKTKCFLSVRPRLYTGVPISQKEGCPSSRVVHLRHDLCPNFQSLLCLLILWPLTPVWQRVPTAITQTLGVRQTPPPGTHVSNTWHLVAATMCTRGSCQHKAQNGELMDDVRSMCKEKADTAENLWYMIPACGLVCHVQTMCLGTIKLMVYRVTLESTHCFYHETRWPSPLVAHLP